MQEDSKTSGENNNRGQGANDSSNLIRPNPLMQFSSYTYMLTLYMMTPECANAFANTGTLPASSGSTTWVVVAQSSGITNNDEPRGLTDEGDFGPKKTGLDFYIDNLDIQTYILGADGQRTSTVSTSFTFNIIEPSGFTFMTRLSQASAYLNNLSSLAASEMLPRLYQQFYAIGIKFYGYDDKGEMVKSQDKSSGFFERIFPIIIDNLNFKLGYKYTIYNVEAKLQNLQAAFGIKQGVIPNQITLEGMTVGDILGSTDPKSKSLVNWLNNYQKELIDKKVTTLQAKYNIEWVDTNFFKSSKIKRSTLITTDEQSLANAKMNNANTTLQSNVKLSVQNKAIDNLTKVVTVAANTTITTVMEQIISKSKYVNDAVAMTPSENIESQSRQKSQQQLTWYAIHPVVKITGRDDKLKDWVYDVTYQIIPYDVPHVKHQFINNKIKYYGPVKKYSYTFTGKNTEVLDFEINFNNLYYLITPYGISKNPDPNLKNTGPTPHGVVGPVNDNSNMTHRNKGGQVLDTVRANILSPADTAVAEVKIIGDPDFLMDSVGYTINDSSATSKFINKNGTINPYGGQIFTEIIFKIAEDYNYENGLMDVDKTQTVGFYTPEEQAMIKNQGIIFRINSVKSNFAKGKFEQVLGLIMVSPIELDLGSAGNQVNSSEQNSARASTTSTTDQYRYPEEPISITSDSTTTPTVILNNTATRTEQNLVSSKQENKSRQVNSGLFFELPVNVSPTSTDDDAYGNAPLP